VLIVLAVVALLAILAVRAAAAPADAGDAGTRDDLELDDPDDELDDRGSGPGAAEPWACPCDVDVLARVAAGAPSVTEVVAAAHRAGGVARDPTPGRRWRSRWSALVPWVTARAGNSESWREVIDPTVSHAVAFDVRVAWRLDRLIFDPAELRIDSADLARRRERRQLASLASRAYFAWLRARAASMRDPRWALRAAVATAELDGLTDGWFSQAASTGTR
jgi:hypothetical protein